MLPVKKNDKAFLELKTYCDKVKLPIKEVLLSDAHLDPVSDIFYAHMPKLVRMAMKKDKFKDFYKNHREMMVAQMGI